MDDRTRAWLYEILNAIHEIDSYFDEDQKNLLFFSSNLKVRRAVERNLELIGDSVSRSTGYLPETHISHSAEIIDTSQRLTRTNDPVSDELLWGIIEQYLPRIREEIHLLIIQKSQ